MNYKDLHAGYLTGEEHVSELCGALMNLIHQRSASVQVLGIMGRIGESHEA
jgi:hypothetical protein